MKSLSLTIVAVLIAASVLTTKAALVIDDASFNFVPLGNTDYGLGNSFLMDVTEQYNNGIGRSGQLTLYNNESGGSVVTYLWLQGQNFIQQQTDGTLSRDQSVIRTLPGGASIGFSTSLVAGPAPGGTSGILPGESYSLVDGEGTLFATPAVEGFESGIYRMAIEVETPGGQFEYFVNGATPVPEPSSGLLVILMLLLWVLARLKGFWWARPKERLQ